MEALNFLHLITRVDFVFSQEALNLVLELPYASRCHHLYCTDDCCQFYFQQHHIAGGGYFFVPGIAMGFAKEKEAAKTCTKHCAPGEKNRRPV